MTNRRAAAALAGALLAVLTVLAAPPPPAHAHAVLTGASPAPASVVPAMPDAVELIFNEPVRYVPDRTVVIAPNGKRVNDGDPTVDGTRLRISLRPTDDPLGTFLVSYRVISADSHPISGSYTFSVGAPSQGIPDAPTDEVHPAVSAAIPVARYLGYAGLCLVIGAFAIVLGIWPRRLPRAPALRMIRVGLVLLAVGALAQIWLQIPYRTGAGPFEISAVEVADTLGTGFGVAMLVRLAAIVVAAVLAGRLAHAGRNPYRRPRRRGSRLALVGLMVGGLLTWPLSGHSGASENPTVTAAADVAHLAGAALWLGGLAVLVLLLRRADRRELAVILPAWSRWAALAVYWLVAAGVLQAVVEVGLDRPELFVQTRYGRLLLAKVVLLVAVLAVAAQSRRLVRRWALSPPAPAPAGRLLRRSVGVELGIAALVLAASAALTQSTPARLEGVEAAAAARATGFVTTLTSPIYTVQFEIFPAQVGPYNTLHAYLYTRQGTPLNPVEWKVTTSRPDAGIAPIDNPVETFRGNQGLGAVNFPLPGTWELRMTIRISEIEQATVSTTVTVG